MEINIGEITVDEEVNIGDFELDVIKMFINTSGLTQAQIEALNNMGCMINDECQLIISYDDTTLDIYFAIEDNNLIAINNVTGLDFNINENGEMEAIY